MNKLVLPIITLIIGIALGYFIGKPKTAEQTKLAEATKASSLPLQAFTFGRGSFEKTHSFTSRPVNNRDTAIKRIAEFHTINQVLQTAGIQGSNGLFDGFYIDAKSLRTILSDTTLSGISFYLGKHLDHPGLSDRIISIYFTGATSANGMPPYKNSNDIYEYVDPCPTACGDVGQ